MMKKTIFLALPIAAMLLWGCQREEGPDYIGMGFAAVEQMEYHTAIENFETAILQDKELISAYRGKGIASMALGDYKTAVDSFESAYLLTDEKKMPETRRDLLYYKATALYKMGSFDDTIANVNALLQTEEEADAYYLRGACYMEKGEFEKAKLDFDSAVSKAPRDYDLYLNIYNCYLEKSRSADGYPYLNQALTINDYSEKADYQKARIYYFLEDYEKAKNNLDKLAEKGDRQALELLGKIYLKLDDLGHSRKCYQTLIEKYQETAEYDNGLVLCEIKEGNYREAIALIEQGMALEGQQGKQELLYNWIVALQYLGDFEAAKEKAAEYVKLYPADEKGLREYTFLSTR